jgi:hypothetical protein
MTATAETKVCFEPYAGQFTAKNAAGELYVVDNFSVRFGQRMSVTDPRYRAGHFLPEGTSEEELRAEYQRAINRESAKAEVIMQRTLAEMRGENGKGKKKKPPTQIRPEDIPLQHRVVLLKRLGPIGASGVMRLVGEKGEPAVVEKGAIADARWKLVKRNRKHTVPVLLPGVDPATALVVRETLTQLGADGGTIARRVYAGQWISPDDPLVEIHGADNGLFSRPDGRPGATPGELIIVARSDQVTSDSGRFGREFAD